MGLLPLKPELLGVNLGTLPLQELKGVGFSLSVNGEYMSGQGRPRPRGFKKDHISNFDL